MALKLTELARMSIEAHLEEDVFVPDKDTKKKYSKKGACFVTLTKNKQLRGCIGSLEAVKELWKDVQENAINAAFKDSRFPALATGEFGEIKIEVSVLSPAEKLIAKNSAHLLEKIDKHMGIILKHGQHTATFLPQVWEEIPNKEKFLEQLSLKAGIDKHDWKDSELWFYTVTSEKE